jgi:hypothetical protein
MDGRVNSIVVRRSCHHLLYQAIERGDSILGLAPTEDPGVVDIQGAEVHPGSAALVRMLYPHRAARPARPGWMFPNARLDAGLFIC